MSADNWAVCPRCVRDAYAEHERLMREASEAYGHVSVDEFDRLRAEAAQGVDEEKYRTFREDYEIYVADNTVKVSYSGHCQTAGCAAGVDFNHERLIGGMS